MTPPARRPPWPGPRILAVSVTERGRALAARLPFEAVHGRAGPTVRSRWQDVDGLVLVLATGAAVRIVAPLLEDKATDPAVVCLDDAGRFAVALAGGHGGANALARFVADQVGAQPVVSTASEDAGLPPLDALGDLVATGDVAGVMRAMLDGERPTLANPLAWPLPPELAGLGGGDPAGPAGEAPQVVVTDLAGPERPHLVRLHPPSLVAGVGASTDATPDDVASLLDRALAHGGLARASLAEVATIDRRGRHPAVTGLGTPVRTFPAEALGRVTVPTPSPVVLAAVGTPSVAEAAALLAAGAGGDLCVTKLAGPRATVALARRRGPRGRLTVVGLGPGHPRHRTPAAAAAVRDAEVVVGYTAYLDCCADLVSPGQEVVPSPLGEEVARADLAVSRARAGQRVALVCSGDPGIYAMASIAIERAAEVADPAAVPGTADAAPAIGTPPFDVEVLPGVSAGQAAAALLGAPLGHDHAVISLSDLLTPWAAIEARLAAAGRADLAVVLYNPRSRTRTWQLPAALQVLGRYRPPTTPVGLVTDAHRPGEQVRTATLADLDPAEVGMTSCVIVGSGATRAVGDHVVTPRGYRR